MTSNTRIILSLVLDRKLCKSECSICLTKLRDYDRSEYSRCSMVPDCGHVFHKECIEKWLLSNTSCPLCRAELPSTCFVHDKEKVEPKTYRPIGITANYIRNNIVHPSEWATYTTHTVYRPPFRGRTMYTDRVYDEVDTSETSERGFVLPSPIPLETPTVSLGDILGASFDWVRQMITPSSNIFETADRSESLTDQLQRASEHGLETDSTQPLEHTESESAYDGQDIRIVMHQSLCTREEAIRALEENNGDIVDAIMDLEMFGYTREEVIATLESNALRETPPSETHYDYDETDINLIMQQSLCTREQVIEALEKHRGDIVNAIMELTL